MWLGFQWKFFIWPFLTKIWRLFHNYLLSIAVFYSQHFIISKPNFLFPNLAWGPSSYGNELEMSDFLITFCFTCDSFMAVGLLTAHEVCKMQTQNYHKSDIFGTLLPATLSISWGTVLAAAGANNRAGGIVCPQSSTQRLYSATWCCMWLGCFFQKQCDSLPYVNLLENVSWACHCKSATAYSTLLTSKSTSIKVTVTVPQLKKKGQEIWQKGPFNRQIFRPNLKFNFNFNIQNFLLKAQCFMSKNKQNQIPVSFCLHYRQMSSIS